MIASPLEQFDIISLIPLSIGQFDISFTNSSLFIVMIFTTLFLMFSLATLNSTVVPSRWQVVVEEIYSFVAGLIEANVGEKGQRWFPFIFTLFVFLLFSNLFGMIPYSFTVTSHIAVTFTFGVAIWIGVTIIGLVEHKLHFFSLFLPAGVPMVLAPLLVPIEFLSYLSRAVSLPLRLFANMMSGHCLLKIIAGFGFAMFTSASVGVQLVGLIPVAFVVIITGLEIGIALLQAYVFTVLVCQYLNDAYNLH